MVYLRGNDMEKKQRYCPSCGAKTNDAVCEICGRHTKPISERYHEKNLYIVEDDIASNEERQYRNEQKEKEKKTIENAASYERQAQHPNYEYKEFKHPEFEKPKFEHPRMKFERGKRQRQAHIYKEDKRQGPSTILKNAMGIIIFVLLLIAFIAYNVFASSSHEFEDYNNDSAYTELSNDALVNDHPVTKIDCSVEKGKVILTNPSDYVINGFLNDKAITHVIVFPQQQLRMELQDVAGACPFDGTEESSLLIDKPEISYRYETRITKDNVRTSKLYVHDALSDEELESICHYLLSYGIYQQLTDEERISLYVEKEPKKLLKNVKMNYSDETFTYVSEDNGTITVSS